MVLYYYVIILLYYYPPAAPTNRHRAVGLDIGLIDLTKEFWSQVGTFFQPAWVQNGTKMAPKWSQDGPKMASWRVLGPFGGQVGPKMEPRGFQGRKTQFVPPMLGPKLGPHFRHFQHQGGSQEAWRPTWMTCCVQTPSFRRNVVSQSSPGTPKI